MGSFKQITIGAICVGAAFLFGQYLNHHPNPDDVTHALMEVDSNSPELSKTSLLEPGMRLPQSASIATMRQPVQSYSEQSLHGDSTFPNFVSRDRADAANSPKIALPPPSQLDSASVSNATQNRREPVGIATAPMPNLLTQKQAAGIMVPDFSELAAEFKNTPLELPPLVGGASRPPTGGSPTVYDSQLEHSIHDPERANFNPFSRVPPSPLAASSTVTEPSPLAEPSTLANRIDDALVHQVQSALTDFSDEDFAPKLNERFQKWASADPNQNGADQFTGIMSVTPSEPTAIPPSLRETKFSTPARAAEESQPLSARTPDQWNLGGNGRPATGTSTAPSQATVGQPERFELPARRPPAENQLPSNRADGNLRWTVPTTTSEISLDQGSNNPKNTYRSAKPMIPFGLTESERSRIVEIRKPIDRQIKLSANRFTDHITQPGDTLQTLSTKYFGRPDFYLDIYMANQGNLRNPADVPIGMTLKIPVYE
jgi:nucleoid-associated protein YgaU